MSVKKNISSGIFYTAITKYTGIFISIIIGSILARLLSPAEFGVVALILVFISFFNLLSDIGIGPAIIQNKTLEEKDIQSIFSFSLLLGFILAVLFFILAKPIASFYENAELIPLIHLLSFTVLFSAFKIVPGAILLKRLDFKRMGIATVLTQLLSGILAIVFAYKGHGYYALVYKSIFDAFVSFVIFYSLAPIKLKFRLQKESLQKITRFSTFQFLFNFINYFSRNMDNLLIGKYIGQSSLGFYDKSYQLMMMPVQNLTHVITPVLHPVLSEYHNDKSKVYNAYIKVVELLATIGFPLSVFLYFSAHDIIFTLYGAQWGQSIPVFKVLALTLGMQIVLSSSGSIFQALNRTDLLFYTGLVSAVFMVLGICYGVFVTKSLVGVGYGLIIAFFINFNQGFFLLIRVALGFSFIKFLMIFRYPVFISIAIAIVLWLLSAFNFENIYFSLVIKVIVTFIVFVFLNLFNVKNREVFLRFFKRFFK